MATNNMNMDGMMLFEQPFARQVPYENYRKVFRTSQKNIEKELGALQSTANDLMKRARAGEGSPEEALKAVEGMVKRTETLKRKLIYKNASGLPTLSVTRERLEHLSTVESITSANGPEFARWADTRLDRWLVDWALRNGKEKTARSIARERGIETFFSDIRRIENALTRQSCTEALAWCSENKAALRKVKNPLEFDLRLQEFIELSRIRNLMEAIAYQKKYLIQWQDTHSAQINQAAALLAYTPATAFGPYKALEDMAARNDGIVTCPRTGERCDFENLRKVFVS
ncbi:hypothetical protein EW026_g1744 [Hermanssonia centrifuga]|uniref:CTLH domain-containing protein n=1 Tax=Hermanssonia centrifuga TaxID=98765 RepID=A0A4S4KR20_9APHY|nr:hypothetical protein EW026_g1744 [Hermanssonia centrifuga]